MMMTKTISEDVLIYLTFWAVYAPLAVYGWHSEGWTLVELSIILLIGLGLVLFGLLIKEKYLDKGKTALSVKSSFKTPKTPILKHSDSVPSIFGKVFEPDFGGNAP